MKNSSTVKLTEGIYWIGSKQNTGGLKCNPYLLIDGDEAVLFDPGSPLDFEEVYANIESLIPIKNVKYVVLHPPGSGLLLKRFLFLKRRERSLRSSRTGGRKR